MNLKENTIYISDWSVLGDPCKHCIKLLKQLERLKIHSFIQKKPSIYLVIILATGTPPGVELL